MSAKTNTHFYYDATIMRDGVAGKRQGTVGAPDARAAADLIVSMASDVWERPLVLLKVYEWRDNGACDLVLESKIGDGHGPVLKSVPFDKKEDKPAVKSWEHNDIACGYDPYSGVAVNDSWKDKTTFWPSAIGTHYQPEVFAMLILPPKGV